MRKGDIVYGKNNKQGRGHPIVYLQDYNENLFLGVMLTRSSKYSNNIPLTQEHIKKVDLKGRSFKFKFNNTHFVKQKLFKKKEWEPFERVGELTELGLNYVESKVNNKQPRFW